MSKVGEDVEVLRKTIKQLLFMIVSYGETIGVKAACSKGKVIKFEKIDLRECGEIYSKYQLLVEFYPAYPTYAKFGDDEKQELEDLRKFPFKDKTPDQMKRLDFLKNVEKSYNTGINWNTFVKNIGSREVTVSYELDD